MDIKIFFALASIVFPMAIILFYAHKKSLLRRVIIKKFSTYLVAIEFLEKITANKRSVWRRTMDYCNPITPVETQQVGKFGKIDKKWILMRHKKKPVWLVTNDHFFIERKLRDNCLCTFIGFVSGCKNT